ncbi:MAG: hypothetical protein ACR2PZ_02825, partial [Pseudomonadales bacterium]
MTMKTNAQHKLTLTTLTTLAAFTLLSGVTKAQDLDRTILPLPDPQFHGKIEKTLKDSTPDWPEAVKPPQGAPNVLLI